MPSKPFITDDFLIHNKKGLELFERFARDMPILDYHCHLPPADVANDRRFNDLFEIWLEGDHYKWRAMRSNGEPERYCTGDASPFDKFMAWARTVPRALRNPLYHWTHLELKRYFDVDDLLGPQTARAIWDKARERLSEPEMSALGIMRKFKVAAVCTTDDPTDDLSHHARLARSETGVRVYPAFRPDKAMALSDPAAWNRWVDKLGQMADVEIGDLESLLAAIERRHDFFHQLGCRLSDHGLEKAPSLYADEKKASAIFADARGGKEIPPPGREAFAGFLMLFFGRLDARKGWTKQLHLGAMRDNNSRAFKRLGPDVGFDSIGDLEQGRSLAAYLDGLDSRGELPKTIIYNLNPSHNYLVGTMIGNFQDGSIPGKIQFGSGWWFLDQKEGIEWQLNALSGLGLLSRFVGMLTDSRSFMSYPRHEYFRRVLCNLIGAEVESGEIPDEDELVGAMIRDVCFNNARDYLGLEVPESP